MISKSADLIDLEGEALVAALEQRFKTAAGLLREVDMPFELAVVLLGHGEWLASADRPDDAIPILSEARETFERLGAAPYLDRLAKIDLKLTTV